MPRTGPPPGRVLSPMRAEKRPTTIRRAEIVRAALFLISSGGLKALSVAAIAHLCGLAPSAVYRHFKGKDDIIDGVLDLIGSMLAENRDRALTSGAAPGEALKRLFDLHIRMIMENRGIPRLLFSDEPYAGRADRKRKVYRIIHGYLDHVHTYIEAAQKDNTLGKRHSPSTLAYLFLGLVQPSAILWHLSDGREDITRLSSGAWDAYHEVLT